MTFWMTLLVQGLVVIGTLGLGRVIIIIFRIWHEMHHTRWHSFSHKAENIHHEESNQK